DGSVVDITYDWRLRAEKPLLRNLSFLLKPLFEANHRWAMAQGEESLKLELARRRAISDAARAAVPPPPGPVTYAAAGLLPGVVRHRPLRPLRPLRSIPSLRALRALRSILRGSSAGRDTLNRL